MPIALLIIGGAILLGGGGLYAAGEGVDEAGNGTLKIAAGLAVATGAYLAFKKWG